MISLLFLISTHGNAQDDDGFIAPPPSPISHQVTAVHRSASMPDVRAEKTIPMVHSKSFEVKKSQGPKLLSGEVDVITYIQRMKEYWKEISDGKHGKQSPPVSQRSPEEVVTLSH